MPAITALLRAFRALRKAPSLTIVATLSLGLGVGVNTTLYSVFRAVFLVSPSSTAPGRLVRLEPGNSNQISYPTTSLSFRRAELCGWSPARRRLQTG
jgi:hypothetical protein